MNQELFESAAADQEKPYERFLRFGPESLTERELLAIILRTGTRGESAMDLAGKVLSLGSYPREGILGLMDISVADLMQIPGIGEVKAVKLKAISELSKRLHMARAKLGLTCHNPASVASYFMEELRHLHSEVVVLACFDAKQQLICTKQISRGGVNFSFVSPRSVFLEALRAQAVGIILLHNHPSGDPTPSRQDREVTQRLRKAGREIDIPLLDHIIIGDNCYTSFLESHLLEGEG